MTFFLLIMCFWGTTDQRAQTNFLPRGPKVFSAPLVPTYDVGYIPYTFHGERNFFQLTTALYAGTVLCNCLCVLAILLENRNNIAATLSKCFEAVFARGKEFYAQYCCQYFRIAAGYSSIAYLLPVVKSKTGRCGTREPSLGNG